MERREQERKEEEKEHKGRPRKEMGEKDKTREHLRRPFMSNHLDMLSTNPNTNMQIYNAEKLTLISVPFPLTSF